MQTFTFWTLLAAWFVCAGCSSNNDDDRNADGGRGPRPPPSQASLFFVIGPPGVPGPGCQVSGSYVANIGGPPRANIGDPGPRVIDGEGDARVSCRVAGSTTFDVSGSAQLLSTSFAVREATVSGGAGTATIVVAGPGTAGAQLGSASGACSLELARAPYQIAAGNIWASFECPVVTSPSAPSSQCSARGEFIFENCAQD